MEILARLRQYIDHVLLDGASELDADTPLLESGVLDSLTMVDLLAFIESELGVRIADEDVLPANFATLTAISRLVIRKRASLE